MGEGEQYVCHSEAIVLSSSVFIGSLLTMLSILPTRFTVAFVRWPFDTRTASKFL